MNDERNVIVTNRQVAADLAAHLGEADSLRRLDATVTDDMVAGSASILFATTASIG